MKGRVVAWDIGIYKMDHYPEKLRAKLETDEAAAALIFYSTSTFRAVLAFPKFRTTVQLIVPFTRVVLREYNINGGIMLVLESWLFTVKAKFFLSE